MPETLESTVETVTSNPIPVVATVVAAASMLYANYQRRGRMRAEEALGRAIVAHPELMDAWNEAVKS